MIRIKRIFQPKIISGVFVSACICVLGWPALAGQNHYPLWRSATGGQGGSPQGQATKQTSATNPQPQTMSPRQEAETRADLLVLHKQYAEAAEAYEEVLRQDPHNAVLMNKLGMAYLNFDEDQAKKWFERATKADKHFANPFNNLGAIYYNRRKYGRAVQSYRKALALDPSMAVTYENMGRAYFVMKKYPEAMDAFQHALALDPGIFERAGRGGSLVDNRTMFAERGLFFFFLAKSFAVRGDAPECARYLKRAIEEGYAKIAEAKNDQAFKPVLRDPTVRELLQLEPLPPDKREHIAFTNRPPL